jgi:hypothetical protein
VCIDFSVWRCFVEEKFLFLSMVYFRHDIQVFERVHLDLAKQSKSYILATSSKCLNFDDF